MKKLKFITFLMLFFAMAPPSFAQLYSSPQIGGPSCLTVDETGLFVTDAPSPYSWSVTGFGMTILGSSTSSSVTVQRESTTGSEQICLTYGRGGTTICKTIAECEELYCDPDPCNGDPHIGGCEASLNLDVCTLADENGNYPHPGWRVSIFAPFGAVFNGTSWYGTNINILNEVNDDYLIFEPTSEGGLTVCAHGSYTLNGQTCIFDICEDYYTWDSRCSSPRLSEDTAKNSKEVTLFYNSNTNQVNIGMIPNNAKTTFTLYSFNGAPILNQAVKSMDIINLPNLPSGVYVVEILMDDGTRKVEKVLVP